MKIKKFLIGLSCFLALVAGSFSVSNIQTMAAMDYQSWLAVINGDLNDSEAYSQRIKNSYFNSYVKEKYDPNRFATALVYKWTDLYKESQSSGNYKMKIEDPSFVIDNNEDFIKDKQYFKERTGFDFNLSETEEKIKGYGSVKLLNLQEEINRKHGVNLSFVNRSIDFDLNNTNHKGLVRDYASRFYGVSEREFDDYGVKEDPANAWVGSVQQQESADLGFSGQLGSGLVQQQESADLGFSGQLGSGLVQQQGIYRTDRSGGNESFERLFNSLDPNFDDLDSRFKSNLQFIYENTVNYGARKEITDAVEFAFSNLEQIIKSKVNNPEEFERYKRIYYAVVGRYYPEKRLKDIGNEDVWKENSKTLVNTVNNINNMFEKNDDYLGLYDFGQNQGSVNKNLVNNENVENLNKSIKNGFDPASMGGYDSDVSVSTGYDSDSSADGLELRKDLRSKPKKAKTVEEDLRSKEERVKNLLADLSKLDLPEEDMKKSSVKLNDSISEPENVQKEAEQDLSSEDKVKNSISDFPDFSDLNISEKDMKKSFFEFQDQGVSYDTYTKKDKIKEKQKFKKGDPEEVTELAKQKVIDSLRDFLINAYGNFDYIAFGKGSSEFRNYTKTLLYLIGLDWKKLSLDLLAELVNNFYCSVYEYFGYGSNVSGENERRVWNLFKKLDEYICGKFVVNDNGKEELVVKGKFQEALDLADEIFKLRDLSTDKGFSKYQKFREKVNSMRVGVDSILSDYM